MALRFEAQLISRCLDNPGNNSGHLPVFREWAERWFNQGKINQFEYEYLQTKMDEKEYALERERTKYHGLPHVLRRADRIRKDDEARQKSHLKIVKTASDQTSE